MIELETSPWRGKAQHKVDSEGLSAEEKDYPVVSKGKNKGPSEASLKSDYRLGHQERVKLSFPFYLYIRMGLQAIQTTRPEARNGVYLLAIALNTDKGILLSYASTIYI